MPRLRAVDSPAPPIRSEWQWTAKQVGWILGAMAAGLLLACLVVVAARLETVSVLLRDKTTAEDLARTRYDSQMRELHNIEVSLNYVKALYDDDVRRGIIIIHDKKEK